MPWKIVNLDLDQNHAGAARPHLHLKDPNAAIHLRTFFADQRVEIGLGAEDPEECFVRATVTANEVLVQATKFEAVQVQILASILASLDVEPEERKNALAWMQDELRSRGSSRGPGEMFPGNVTAFPTPTGWPYDLTDDALLESLEDREDVPHTRVSALLREAQRRGFRASTSEQRTPEIVRRRPRP